MKTQHESLPHFLKSYRELKGFSLRYLALKLNVSIATLSNLENYKTELTISRAKEIAQILEIDFQHLFENPLSFLPPPAAGTTWVM